jgi:teichoic acid transport system ATP-binding protein
MRTRLGFSILANLNPEVFIIDEALGAGDASFQEKASARLQELIAEADAVIVVTHDMQFVERVCTRALWLDAGRVRADGKPEEVLGAYRQAVQAV